MLPSQTARQWAYAFFNTTCLLAAFSLVYAIANQAYFGNVLLFLTLASTAATGIAYHLAGVYRTREITNRELLASGYRLVLDGKSNIRYFNLEAAQPEWMTTYVAIFIGIYALLALGNHATGGDVLGSWLILANILLWVGRIVYLEAKYDLKALHYEVTAGDRFPSGHKIHKLPHGDFVKLESADGQLEYPARATPELRDYLMKCRDAASGKHPGEEIPFPSMSKALRAELLFATALPATVRRAGASNPKADS